MGSISEIFATALTTASKAYNLPTIEPSTQELYASAFQGLTSLLNNIAELSLFSPNETLEDISTTHLVYLLVPYVLAEVRSRISNGDGGPGARVPYVKQTQRCLRGYVETLEQYEIVAGEEKELYAKDMGKVPAVQRREIKIQQYKKEKELRTRIEAVRKRRHQTLASSSSDSSSDFDLILSLLPHSTTSEDDDEDDETLRTTTLLLLRLLYTQARSQLDSTAQELDLLRSAARHYQQQQSERGQQVDDARLRGGENEKGDDMWKLDRPDPKSGPLLDESGKPLRPFTILPSGTTAADRARLKAQVFGPDHNLPTMTIDEYLQIEQERGNIITGGGAASANAPTSSEQLALDAEMDGTREGDEKEEQKRLKDENWARYTDENPKGAGNTMNRG